jgi:DNA-binding NarL/FixJ family response regulator
MEPLTTLAIADDHVMYRKGLMSIISRLNARFVAEASNGQDLLDQLEALEEKPGICILDVNMPIMDGHVTLRELKQRWPEIKVLVLTMLDSEATARTMLQQGAAAYLVKDSAPEELDRAIRSIIETGSCYPAG